MTSTWNGDLASARVGPEVFDLRPDYVAHLIVVRGLQPGPSSTASETALAEAEAAALGALDGRDAQELAELADWRAAFAAFGVKPRVGRSSAEALMRRAASGLPRIDRLTDTYNAVSVIHRIPIGGEDLAGYVGPPRLTIAKGDEPFETVADGQALIDRPEPGEVVWRDDAGVTCRRWNWRQCVRTRLTESTVEALFIIDGLGADAREHVLAAATDLASRLSADSPTADFASRTVARDDPA